MKLVGPGQSAIFTAHGDECHADRAKVTINDEYGFFVESAIVTAQSGHDQ